MVTLYSKGEYSCKTYTNNKSGPEFVSLFVLSTHFLDTHKTCKLAKLCRRVKAYLLPEIFSPFLLYNYVCFPS